jgi:hypothetical protein
MTDKFDLDREVSIQNGVDAEGKKWVIKAQRGNGLLYARPDPDRENAVIPKDLSGLWTKIGLLQKQIGIYLDKSWNQAEEAKLKAERKAQAAKEAAAKRKAAEKAKKVTDDAGTTAS